VVSRYSVGCKIDDLAQDHCFHHHGLPSQNAFESWTVHLEVDNFFSWLSLDFFLKSRESSNLHHIHVGIGCGVMLQCRYSNQSNLPNFAANCRIKNFEVNDVIPSRERSIALCKLNSTDAMIKLPSLSIS